MVDDRGKKMDMEDANHWFDGVRFKMGAIIAIPPDESGSGAELPRADSQSARQNKKAPNIEPCPDNGCGSQ